MIFRKIFIVSVFVLIVGSFTFGDAVKEQDIDMGVLGQSNLHAISLQTCDGQPFQSVFSGTIRPHQIKDFCIVFANSSSKDIKLDYGFTDYGFTKEGYVACAQNINTGNLFSHILRYGTSVISVPAQGFTIQRVSLQAPLSGQIKGCISYTSLNDSMTAGMFNVVLRKTDIVDLKVAGEYYGWWEEMRDQLMRLKNDRNFWIGMLVVLGLLFLYVLRKKPTNVKRKK